MSLFKYQRISTSGPDGTTLYFKNAESQPKAVELAHIDGWHYVFVPPAATLPAQPEGINWQSVTMTTLLYEQIKATSRPVQLIADEMQRQIRALYTLEDEQYFARIGVGAALNVYTLEAGEMDALIAFGAHVESIRQWGRDERAAIGVEFAA